MTLVIPTDGRRPALLRRCIAGHARQSELDGVTLDLVVCDNSGRADREAATREVLREFAVGMSVRFIGTLERRRYVDALVEQLGPRLRRDASARDAAVAGARAELEYALGPLEFGAGGSLGLSWPRQGSDAPARNALQLAEIGHRYVSVDDDTTAFFSTVPRLGDDDAMVPRMSADDEPWADSSDDPTEFWFYPSAQAAFDDAPRANLRPLYESLFMNALDGQHVLAAMTGLVGDSAMSPSPFLLTRALLTRAHVQNDYELARRARHVRRGVRQPTLTSHPHFMTVCAAFDGRALLPPFLPLQRNADGLWGSVLRATTGSLIAHVPYCVTHDPGEERPAMLSELGAAPTPAGLVRLVVDVWPRGPVCGNSAARMRSLATHLLTWAELDAPEFERRLCSLRWAELERGADRLQAEAELADVLERNRRPGALRFPPEKWRDDVVEAARAKYLLVGNPLAIHPPGAGARSYLAAYARLLELWPLVDDAARQLAARGVRLSVEEPPF